MNAFGQEKRCSKRQIQHCAVKLGAIINHSNLMHFFLGPHYYLLLNILIKVPFFDRCSRASVILTLYVILSWSILLYLSPICVYFWLFLTLLLIKTPSLIGFQGQQWFSYFTPFLLGASYYKSNLVLFLAFVLALFDTFTNQGSFYWQVFKGNSDSHTLRHSYLEHPVSARFVRVHVVDWHRHPSLRLEIVGHQGNFWS